jgi:hypothetical protein
MLSERQTVVELPWAADCCPCVEKLRTVLPFSVGIRDGAVQLVLTHQRVQLVLTHQRVQLVLTHQRVQLVLTHQRVRTCGCCGGADKTI